MNYYTQFYLNKLADFELQSPKPIPPVPWKRPINLITKELLEGVEMEKGAVFGFKGLTGNTGPIKALIRQVRATGGKVVRVKPKEVAAQSPHTSKLPVGESGYTQGFWDPVTGNFKNTQFDVGKGLPRTTFTMQPTADGRHAMEYTEGVVGGTNPSPIASFFHEVGHDMHSKAMRRAGIGDMLGGHEVPGLPKMDKVLNEIGANNSALQFLEQHGAKPEVLAYYKGARIPSFNTYTSALKPSTNPIQQKILDAAPLGYTPTYKGVPDLYQPPLK